MIESLLKQLLGRDISEAIFPKEFDRHSLGSCMVAAEMAVKYFLSKGLKDFQVVEGWVAQEGDEDWDVSYNNLIKKHEEYGNVFSHTWIEFKNGRIFDPTRKQWERWGYDPDEMKIVKIKTKYSPEDYLDLCEWEPNDWKKFKKLSEAIGITSGQYRQRSGMINLKTLLIEGIKSVKSVNDLVLKKLAQAAQYQYDSWRQNEEGYDGELGYGGICHLIADDLAGILTNHGIECSTVCSNWEQHVYLICKFKEGIFSIDIPYHIYETGGGFSWKKRPNVKFDSSNVVLSKIDSNPNHFDRYIDIQ